MKEYYTELFYNSEAVPAALLILVAITVVPLSLILLNRYKRAISVFMSKGAEYETDNKLSIADLKTDSSSVNTKISLLTSDSSIEFNDDGQLLYQKLIKKPWITAFCFALGGLAFSTVACIFFYIKEDISFLGYVSIWVTLQWPIVLTLIVVAVPEFSGQIKLFVAYLLVMLLLSRDQFIDFVTFWGIYSAIPTVLTWVILNTRVRPIGPTVVSSIFVSGILSIFLFWTLIYVFEELANALNTTITSEIILIIAVISLLATVWLAYKLALSIAYRYERKKTTELILSVDTIWIIFTYWLSLFMIYRNGDVKSWGWFAAGSLAFLAYKLITVLAFRILSKNALKNHPIDLLFLRVFGHQKRSERLLRNIGLYWRHIGNIQLIAGSDLALTNIEPHEFLTYLNGKTKTLFIKNQAEIEARFNSLDSEIDKDGRYRIHEFFCYDNTWRDTLKGLAKMNECVIMDLRGFSKDNSGVSFEIQQLIELVPLEKVLFMVDETTDHVHLINVFNLSTEGISRQSPNANLEKAEIQVYEIRKNYDQDLKLILKLLTHKSIHSNLVSSS